MLQLSVDEIKTITGSPEQKKNTLEVHLTKPSEAIEITICSEVVLLNIFTFNKSDLF